MIDQINAVTWCINKRRLMDPNQNSSLDQQYQNLNKVTYGDILIIIAIAWIILNSIFWFIISTMQIELYNSQFYKPVVFISNTISSLVPFAIAFAVKNNTIKITSFILAIIYFIFEVSKISIRLLDMQ